MSAGKLVVVTGATGYVGGRLVPELLEAGYRVRILARDIRRLESRPWIDLVEIVEADATDQAAVTEALTGVDVAYYLIHSIGTGTKFAMKDRQTARSFAAAARDVGVGHLVYLSGLYPEHQELSMHLQSRQEVEEIFLTCGVPTTVLRAAVIIGSGSASFEMLRYLTERLPVMVTPRWVDTRIQPIAIRDVLHYLVGAAEIPAGVSRGFDIGGPDVMTYRQMMARYASVAGLPPRRVIKVPVLSPALSSHWVGLVTPVPKSIARPLVASLINEVVCKEHDIADYVPDPDAGLTPFDRAISLALTKIQDRAVVSRWSSASTAGAPSDPLPSDPDWAGGSLYADERAREVDADRTKLWQVINAIGGDTGWYSWPLAWRLRGFADRVIGGPGLRRGRRDASTLVIGDALDFWRVEEADNERVLRLRAEMRLPGLAWLEFVIEQSGNGPVSLRQRALFHPRGLLGHLYWWSVYPFHGIVFGAMLRNIALAAEASSASPQTPPTSQRPNPPS
ncbi:uncharacterized protein YbjT (DUF2867 family) [Antricoccus suffuscus]|uniref:Uncharacterized protein YbjT (DUF2867 family) n=1 Tax=Antricoccus suffuscus TaxID=1629062 RepID=A0A2T1A626_9ACTN|nr:SDR family oxidoreductase [Antricoccus suffuscus]PRZ44065.1 uncharacterized protein YbjT (DUF2867 family) [Antricoccus suffuscus]